MPTDTSKKSLKDIVDERDKYLAQRDQLAHAIAGAAVRTGGCREDAQLTGPMLVQLINDMANTLQETQRELAELRQRADVAPVPDFDAVKGKRVSELDGGQYADASELWLRENKAWFKDAEQINFLLHRLDQARGLNPQGKPWTLADGHTKTMSAGPNEGHENPELQRLTNHYDQLATAVIEGATKAGLLDAALSHRFGPLRHRELLKVTQFLGMAAKEGVHSGVSMDAPPSPKRKPDSNSLEVQRLTRQYEELGHAINQAGRGIGLISTAYRGDLRHAEFLSVIQRVSEAAEKGIKRPTEHVSLEHHHQPPEENDAPGMH